MKKVFDILQNIYLASRKGDKTFRIPKSFFFHLLSKSQKEPYTREKQSNPTLPKPLEKNKVHPVAKKNCPLDAIGALLDRLARVCEGGVTRR